MAICSNFCVTMRMDARNYFTPSPLPQNILKQNQYGATLGGPIRRDKTFFFLSYEGIRSIQDSPGSAVVLTPQQRAGDFSGSVLPSSIRPPDRRSLIT